jgi:outer membrane protein TolC
MRRAFALAVVLGGSVPAGLAAQAADREINLTLEDAISRGLATSHRLAEAVARGEAANAVVGERRAAAMPVATAQAGYTRTNHVTPFGFFSDFGRLVIIYPDVPDNYRTRLDLQWPIYTSGRLGALERAAQAEAAAAGDDLDAARADLRLEITRAYWALVTSIEALRVVEESLTRMDAHLRDVRNQFNAGLVPPNDVSSVEAQESRQRMLTVQARSTRDVTEAELARLIGVDPDVAIRPVSPLAPPTQASMAAARSVLAQIEQARAARAERASLQKHVTAADERQRAAAAGNKPIVGVGGGFDYARPNPRIFPRQDAWDTSWDASINVNWPIFDGGKSRAETAEAAAARRAAAERLADFDTTLAVEVRERASELEATRAAIAAADDAVRSAGEARRVVGDRFGAGVATSTDVLDAQVALLQAELDRTQAVANARLAEARLARAMGQ